MTTEPSKCDVCGQQASFEIASFYLEDDGGKIAGHHHYCKQHWEEIQRLSQKGSPGHSP